MPKSPLGLCRAPSVLLGDRVAVSDHPFARYLTDSSLQAILDTSRDVQTGAVSTALDYPGAGCAQFPSSGVPLNLPTRHREGRDGERTFKPNSSTVFTTATPRVLCAVTIRWAEGDGGGGVDEPIVTVAIQGGVERNPVHRTCLHLVGR